MKKDFQFLSMFLVLSVILIAVVSCSVDDQEANTSDDTLVNQEIDYRAKIGGNDDGGGAGGFNYQGYYVHITCGSTLVDGGQAEYKKFFTTFEKCKCHSDYWSLTVCNIWEGGAQIEWVDCKEQIKPFPPSDAACPQ